MIIRKSLNLTIILFFYSAYFNYNYINFLKTLFKYKWNKYNYKYACNFSRFIINVIVIIFDIIKRDNQSRIKNELLKQLFNNIIYSILISIFTIIFALITYIDFCIIKIIFNAIVYFLLTNFVLTNDSKKNVFFI